MGAATGVSALIGSAAVVAAIGGGVALGLGGTATLPHVAAVPTSAPTSSTSTDLGAAGRGAGAVGNLLDRVGGTDGNTTGGLGGTVNDLTSGVGNTVGSVVNGLGNNVVAPIVGAVTPGASPKGQAAPGGAPVTALVRLGGKGTPGAVVAAQAGGVVYGTATVAANGTWSIQINALPAGVGTLNLKQTLTVLGVSVPINLPLTLNTGPLGVVVKLLN
jgi:hypothetical protein